jgi:hypothetical protein
MKAKLIKTDSNYYLYVDGKIIASTEYVEGKQKLSKQNCDEIFGVVDVELMSDFYGAKAKGSVDFKLGSAQGFEDGFNKAMELSKDKVFTLEDMFNLYAHIVKNGIISGEEANEFIQSLKQPTEIEVEIEMEWVTTKTFCDTCNKVMYPEYRCEDKTCFNWQPKLDSEGCLILIKKI